VKLSFLIVFTRSVDPNIRHPFLQIHHRRSLSLLRSAILKFTYRPYPEHQSMAPSLQTGLSPLKEPHHALGSRGFQTERQQNRQ